MIKRTIKGMMFFFLISFFLFQNTGLYSKDIPFKLIEIDKVSRYHEERIACQHIEKNISPKIDNSISSLLIIKDKKIYLLRDGYDQPSIVQTKLYLLETARKVYEYSDLWVNKINTKPDYIRITERRAELLSNIDEAFVSSKFGNFYITIRNSFLQKHVNIFKKMMMNRRETGMLIVRKPIPKGLLVGADEEKTKYSISVTSKTLEGAVYFAEDGDGDGITETFSVNLSDGFHWGYKSGPNIILVYKNTDDTIRQMMGKLAHYAYYGTPEEEKGIISWFPSDSEIISEFNLERVDIKTTAPPSETGGASKTGGGK